MFDAKDAKMFVAGRLNCKRSLAAELRVVFPAPVGRKRPLTSSTSPFRQLIQLEKSHLSNGCQLVGVSSRSAVGSHHISRLLRL